jgi:glucokinase
MRPWRLVSDVGGSNVRFARAHQQHALGERRSYPLKTFASFYDALSAFLDETKGAAGCASAAVGVAGPIEGDTVKVTNAPWTISAGEVAELLGGAPTRLVNDLQAVALALPHLADNETAPIGAARRGESLRQTMIAVNVGTGFGGATAMPAGAGWITNPGEPGHMTLGALDTGQLELLRDAGSVEEMLSGRGVTRLYRCIAERMGAEIDASLDAAQIFALAKDDATACETLRIFSILLGRVAGDLALAAAAWGGVYLCGSVVNGWAAAGGTERFRPAFEAKGPMRGFMEKVYTGILTRDDTALLGLTHLPIEGFQPASVG